MSAWTKLPPVPKEKSQIGCLCCSSACQVAHMGMVIAVGFGSAYVTRDGQPVYEEREGASLWTVQDAENAALKDPDHDWQIMMMGPLHGETYQRHEAARWVCVESNQGFA